MQDWIRIECLRYKWNRVFALLHPGTGGCLAAWNWTVEIQNLAKIKHTSSISVKKSAKGPESRERRLPTADTHKHDPILRASIARRQDASEGLRLCDEVKDCRAY